MRKEQDGYMYMYKINGKNGTFKRSSKGVRTNLKIWKANKII